MGRKWACPTGKARYRSRKQAEDAKMTLAEISTRQVIPNRVYQCPVCKGYHLTKSPYAALGSEPND